ncbi:hypothetical protein F2Q69_00025984 [Brassica cretica]|uniref:1,3-beta-glucan synthase n=1 Tax=Brassica cretica TaxID=69181 RepID=A0A8S9RV27_BRACR|nr:hypothetical protein F2Q69_00025984 [Brassica cretica]
MEQRVHLRGGGTLEVISSQGDVDREQVLEPFDIENETSKETNRSSSFDVGYSSGDNLETLPTPSKDAISPADILKTLFFILVWYTFSTFLTLYNKTLLGDDLGKFPAPLLMNTIHFSIQAVLSKMITWYWSGRFQPDVTMSWRDYFIRVVPTALATALDINLSNESLVFISVTFATMCKSAAPIFLLLFAFAFSFSCKAGVSKPETFWHYFSYLSRSVVIREEMAKLYQMASVLYDVLKTVVPPARIDEKTHRYAKEVERKKDHYEHYNILPLDAGGAKTAIMELPEIKVAIRAVSNVENLPRPRLRSSSTNPDQVEREETRSFNDILEWLALVFGFQRGNVANQREHLILLLANVDVRKRDLENYDELKPSTVRKLMDKYFKNYRSWCKYLRCESFLRFPPGCNEQQLSLAYIGLYLLIWGEASNIRFMPECLCYIFHKMADEVHGILFSNVYPVTGDTYEAGAPDDEAFLRNVITPIYQVLRKEVRRNKMGKASHSKWRNYDDLNEYFWDKRCFRLGWPMKPEADFFIHTDEIAQHPNERRDQVPHGKRKPKTNFVEARTFWNLYRSFDRMWMFLVLSLQTMMIVAWSPSGSILAIFEEDVFLNVLTIFITSAFLNLLQATLDIILSFGAWKSLKFSQILRFITKFLMAAMWAIILPIAYSKSVQNPTGLIKFFSSWVQSWPHQTLYNYAIALYVLPNILAAVFFLLPPLRRIMERSNMRIVTLIMWWAQPKLYVGRGMHEEMFALFKYTFFWVMLLLSKLAFSFYVEILPLVKPTKLIWDMSGVNYQWHEFFPNATHNIGVIISIWGPIVLVYFMDTQIWYAIFSTIFGGIYGAFSHLGEIRTLGMLRSRFRFVPSAFCSKLTPSPPGRAKRKHLDEQVDENDIARFSQMWNKFIYTMRDEDLISDRYPSLRVAYIDEREETINKKSQKVFYSVLLKGCNKLDEEIYRIKLPGNPTEIGEGKPENQNHAIIFTRGEALQTIDMNQDNYFEETFKMRNVLQEFDEGRRGKRNPTILGLREHIFTGSVSSLAWFMSNQETSFVTIGQRVLANPLRVRFHYGHPDIFDRIFHITRGGISKASKIINLSEDIFAGYNSTLRGGYITHHEYIQAGKGRDVGMNQVSVFEAKVANGNGEQTLSRDVYRLGRRFDFYRMLSFYFTTVGFYFSSMITVLTVYVFLYGRLYLVLSGLEKEILQSATVHQSKALEEALAAQSVFQLGFLMVLPMVMEIGLEKGFRKALGDFIIMQLQLASVFFTFQLGTKAHYFGRTILHGGSKYRATGRGFVVFHAKFADNYRLYSRSHFVKGLELVMLLIVYQVYGNSYPSSSLYIYITFSMWFLVTSWLFAPFIFNPSGFEWQKTVDDWTDWKRWMGNRGGIGIVVEKSWESWWESEQEHLKHTNLRGRVLEILLALRFLLYQYGIVYHLNVAHRDTTILVYGLSWGVLLAVLLVLKMVSMGRRKFGTDFQVMFRILKALLFLGFLSVMTVLFVVCGLTIADVCASFLAFLPTGWAILLIGQALRGVLKGLGFWDSIKELGRAYEYIMGLSIFTPIAVLSWFPFVSEFQTRLLFNQAFSRGLQISMILAGKKDKETPAPSK